VLFSGTLLPQHFYAQLLGLPANTAWLEVPAPFRAAQLQVQLAAHISTRYADRARSVDPIVALMARQYTAAPGNYLAFFSSFEYLAQVEAAFAQAHPEVPRWVQHRGMGEADRQAFVARFEAGGQGIGFAVLGGAFGEGVDLPGRRLIGAFIATLGLPQLNPLNEEMRARMQALFGQGYDYTYLVPGLRKVVQAAGRVIRTVHDQGVVVLIDDRFRRPEVQRLLPGWWGPAQRLPTPG
jgi:Rad3-related DNA helicase